MTEFLIDLPARMLAGFGRGYRVCRLHVGRSFLDASSKELLLLIDLEQAGKPLPLNRVVQSLPKLQHAKIPKTVIQEAVKGCSTGRCVELSLLVATLGGRLHDDHQSSFRSILYQLNQNLSDFSSNKVNTKKAFSRTAYLLALLKFVDEDARNRALPALECADELLSWSEIVRQTADDARRLPIDLICNLLRALRELENKTYFTENLKFWCSHPKHGSSLELLSGLLTVVRSSLRGYSELLDSYEMVSSAIQKSYPTIDLLLRYLGCSFPLSGNSSAIHNHSEPRDFGDRAAVLARLLFNMGRSAEYELIFNSLIETVNESEHRLRLARVLLSTKNRWAVLRGAGIIEEFATPEFDPQTLDLLLQARMIMADWAKVKSIADRLSEDDTLRPGVSARTLYNMYRNLGDFAAAEEVRSDMYASATESLAARPSRKTFREFQYWQLEQSELSFLQETNKQLPACRFPSRPKGLVVLLCPSAGKLIDIPLLALAEAKKAVYAVTSLFPGTIRPDSTNISEIDAIYAQIGDGQLVSRWHAAQEELFDGLLNNWDIDLERRKAHCEGINLFHGIHEALCCEFRRYTINYRHPLVKLRAFKRIVEMDLMVSSVKELKRISQVLDLPIRFLAARHHMSGEYAVRFVTQKLAVEADIRFLGSQSGYDNYYRNFREELSTTIALQDLTKHSLQSRSASISKLEFEQWYARHWPQRSNGFQRPESSILAVVQQNRVRRQAKLRGDSIEFLRRLAGAREAGKSVVALFGKVLFDLGVPYEGGPAHRDMRDWFDHCCELASNHQDLVILIKPHPHEARNDIALFPSEMLRDWLPKHVPDNLIYLDHDMFNVYELSEVIDLGIVWNSTVCLELGILGVPCLVSSWYGAIDYPVGHHQPIDRRDFAKLVCSARSIKPNPDTRSRCMALIEYLRSEKVATPYRYTVREVTNKVARQHGWLQEDLSRYHRDGDKYVEMLAGRIYESFSGRLKVAPLPAPLMGLD